MTLNEKKEMVVQSYKSTFDKGMAYQKATISKAEIDLLEGDEVFQRRLQYYLILEREKVILNMRKFMDSDDEKIAMAATNKFASFVYPDFVEGIRKDEGIKPTIIEDLEMERYTDEELMDIAAANRPKVI